MLVDPEFNDNSEQQFEDSLMSSPEPEYRSIQLGQNKNQQEETQVAASSAAPSPEPERTREHHHMRTGIERHAVEEHVLEQRAENWRDEISSRLSNYAKRRGRKNLAGEYSMQLDFDRPRRSNAATAPALEPMIEQAVPHIEAYAVAAPEPVVEPEPEPEWRPSMTMAEIASSYDVPVEPEALIVAPPERPKRRQHRIIEFPRLFSLERTETSSDELAEKLDKPRILDVPEETEQIVLPLADISLEMQQQAEEAAPQREFELPIQVAGISQRVFAAMADSMIVLFATAVFAGIALNLAKGVQHDKLTLLAGVLVPVVFWALYQYLFLVHAAGTPGMKMAQLRLATFHGHGTNRGLRRTRDLGMVLSLVSAGMGFGWALVDEDTLCWHDRISKTYLTHK